MKKVKSATKKVLFTPLFKMRVVKAKKGKGSWSRKSKHNQPIEKSNHD